MRLLLLILFLIPGVVLAGQQYDPRNQKWVTVPDRTHDGSQKDRDNTRVEKYNAFEQKWSLEKPDSKPEYNPFEQKWEFPK